jgi:hydroxypyruvate reductase
MSGGDRDLLVELYRTALGAADPARALKVALDAEELPVSDRTWILALGKAAHPLAKAAVAWLKKKGEKPAGGIIIAPDPGKSPHASLAVTTGDHPIPGEKSFAAAESLESLVRQVQPRDDVWVLLSGGTTSLIAAPVRGISTDDLRAIYEQVLGAGIDIAAMNRIRKRVSRWAAGRLAVALAHARVRVFVVSDVIGDDVASIASGPCSPDPSTALIVRASLDEAGLLHRVPRSLIDLLDRTERRMVPETPKAADAAFRAVTTSIIASNRVALRAAGAAAETNGLLVRMRRKPLKGEAAVCGERLAHRFVADALADAAAQAADAEVYAGPVCYLCGGETTVTLDEDAGVGGRCQELALAAARVLDGAAPEITFLAAGTDGRDGPTDAAGAIVDRGTWARIANAGRNGADDLARHNAFHSLEAAGDLIRTGPTGTNVMDLIMAIVRPKPA